MQFAFVSDRGKVRKLNEDAGGVYLHPHGHFLAVVADGMGGHRAGDVASAMAIEKIQEYWKHAPDITKPVEAESWLISSIETLNQELYHHSLNNQDCEGMGTTIVAAICTPEFITLGNVGDSRGYILTENRLRQLTEDHSFVNALVQSGEISKSDAENHPKKNFLLKSLGSKGLIKPSVSTMTIEQDDLILLCSDGLSNKVDEQTIVQTLTQNKSIQLRADTLVQLANDNGGEDNITIAMVEYNVIEESEGIK